MPVTPARENERARESKGGRASARRGLHRKKWTRIGGEREVTG
jgi:hypothetical protein